MSAEPPSRILVVERNKPELRLLCRTLEQGGFDAVACSSADDALVHVESGDIGAAIVDLGLSDVSGLELLERIRSANRRVPVVIYAGTPTDDGISRYESVKEALNLGAFGYVDSLDDPGELLHHVRRAFRERVDHRVPDSQRTAGAPAEDSAQFDREVEDLASVVVHDLRSPMLTISGYCQILQEEYSSDMQEEAKESLAHIAGGAERIGRLIEGLSAYSRVGHSDRAEEPVHLDAVLTQVKTDLAVAIREHEARIEVGRLPAIHGDAAQLAELFRHLVDNALQSRHEIPPVVEIDASHHGDCWQFAVKDNGVGVAREDFDRIFQPFQRGRGRPRTTAGVGLAICRRIVHRHGGQIWLESDLGQGTTFYFTLRARSGQ